MSNDEGIVLFSQTVLYMFSYKFVGCRWSVLSGDEISQGLADGSFGSYSNSIRTFRRLREERKQEVFQLYLTFPLNVNELFNWN